MLIKSGRGRHGTEDRGLSPTTHGWAGTLTVLEALACYCKMKKGCGWQLKHKVKRRGSGLGTVKSIKVRKETERIQLC